METTITPLRQWLTTNNLSIGRLAKTLGVSRPRVQFWVRKETMPRGALLHALLSLTGLPLTDLIPDESVLEARRTKMAHRRAQEKRRRRRTVKKRGKPGRTLSVKRGNGKRTPRNQRRRARR